MTDKRVAKLTDISSTLGFLTLTFKFVFSAQCIFVVMINNRPAQISDCVEALI